MSADNWAHCIRCDKRAKAGFEEREKMIELAYGQVSISEFDAMRDALDRDREAQEKETETFREDYEIYGADEGVVHVEYKGNCTKCGLKLEFAYHQEIPGVDTP